MSAFWVVGGRYADTRFETFAEGSAEERYGPFASYAEAWAEWRRRSWQRVDECYVRYRIIDRAEAA